MSKELHEAITKLSPKDGDLLFFDLGAVDVADIEQLCLEPPVPLPKIVLIGMSLRHGQSVEDAVFDMSKSELEALIHEKS